MEGAKTLRILSGEIKTPPMSLQARREAGSLLRDLQDGLSLSMPHSRPMPSIGASCHELRVRDEDLNWRVMYYLSEEEIVILDVFAKKTRTTPDDVIDNCKRRLKLYLDSLPDKK